MSEWISVKDERRPPLAKDEEYISVAVLLFVPSMAVRGDDGVRMGHFYPGSKTFKPQGAHGYDNDVTHWMPKPSPPTI